MALSFIDQLQHDYATDCGAVSAADSVWSSLLQQAPSKPDKLYYAGNINLLNSQCLSIVGSRLASPQGLKTAHDFAACAADRNITIVSGGALGCDQAAHKGALSVCYGKTIAVMGCGLNVIYPPGASALYKKIIKHEGLLISQYEHGARPTQWSFVERNKVIAGLSQATLVVEAAQKSGTFSTADATLAQGKDVLAIPGSIYSLEFSGSNQLIAQGATPIISKESFIDAIEYLFNCNKLPFSERALQLRGSKNQHKVNKLSPLEQLIYNSLLNCPQSLDAIYRNFPQGDDKIDSMRLNMIMSSLELQGLVQLGNDGRYQAI